MNHRPFSTYLLVACVLLGCASPGILHAQATGIRKTSFQEVTAQLDPGGSLYAYVSTERYFSGLSTNLAQFRQLTALVPDEPPGNRQNVEQLFDLITNLAKLSGIESLTGVGVSGLQISPKLFRTKMLAHHAAGEGNGFLWTLFGRSPHPWRTLDLLPEDTALAFHTDLDAAGLWQTLSKVLTQSGNPQAAQFVQAWPEEFEKKTTIPWVKLLESLDGELGLALTLDPARTIQAPAGNAEVELPQPGLLISVRVKNELLYEKLSKHLQRDPAARTTDPSGLKLCRLPIPALPQFGLEASLATAGGYFFVASSPSVVKAALATQKGTQPGLKSTPEFQTLAGFTPTNGNQFGFVSRRFGEMFGSLQQQTMGHALPPEVSTLLPRLFGHEPGVSLTVRAHTDIGWQSTTVGNKEPTDTVLLAPTVGFSAVGAGMLLPALAKAKAKSQSIQSVSQLKQIALAARIYANDHGDRLPPANTWCDAMKDLIDNDKILKSPNDPSPGRCSYAYNSKVAGKRVEEVPPDTVMFFQTAGGWNQTGGRELLAPSPGPHVIAFADGSVQQITPDRLKSLRWEP